MHLLKNEQHEMAIQHVCGILNILGNSCCRYIYFVSPIRYHLLRSASSQVGEVDGLSQQQDLLST